LVSKLGESYGRMKWAWFMQRYDILPWDEVPEQMMVDAMAVTEGGVRR
jgi:hypothetical protein